MLGIYLGNYIYTIYIYVYMHWAVLSLHVCTFREEAAGKIY